MEAAEFLKKYPCNRVLKAGKEFWGRYTLLRIMNDYAEYRVSELNKSHAIKSVCEKCNSPYEMVHVCSNDKCSNSQ